MARLDLPTVKHIRDATQKAGRDWYVYVAIYRANGSQEIAAHRTASRSFALRLGTLALTPPDKKRSNPTKKKRSRK